MAIEAAFIVPHPPLIVPSVGRGDEKGIQATIDAYEEVARRIAQIAPQTIVLSSPHATMYSDYFHISPGSSAHGDMARFRAPREQMDVTYDTELVEAICDEATEADVPAGTLGERDPDLDHATFVPLFFVNQHYRDYKLVRVGLSGLSPLDHYELGTCIQKAVQKTGRKVVYIASGDLSHKLMDDGPYGFAKEGPQFDEQVTGFMAEADFLGMMSFDDVFCENAAECGLRSFQIMAGALDGLAVKPELLSYEGPFGVGYGVAAFTVTGGDKTRCFGERYLAGQRRKADAAKSAEDPYVQLERLSLETYVKTGERAQMPQGLPADMLDRRAGVFCSIKKHGQLRGCIGTIGPVTGSIAEEIMRNAVSAGTEDPRFPAVIERELPDLVYSVDVLGPTEDIDSPDQLDVKRYGVIVTHGMRRGLLLPNLDGVDTVDQQIDIARQKGGIGKDEKYSLQRFEVVRHT